MSIFLFVLLLGSVQSASLSSRVVGGENANPGDFPFSVDIQKSGQHWCGGFIYNQNWIVTTASCVYRYAAQPQSFTVVVGQVSLTSVDPGEETIPVWTVHINENYDSTTYKNDLAMLQLTRPITFGSYVDGILVGDLDSTVQSIVTGWADGNSGEITNLKFATVPIQPDTNCYPFYNTTGEWDSQSMICAGDAERDACNTGDAGGPMIQPTDGFRVVALVSHNKNCNSSLEQYPPTVYTRLYSFTTWMETKGGPPSVFIPEIPITVPTLHQCSQAIVGQFPFIVSVTSSNSMEHLCSGFIYNQQFVVTPASCVVRKNGPMLNVTVGQFRFDRPEASEKTYPVTSISLHPQYHEFNQTNNIAVLQVSGSIDFQENVDFINYDSADYENPSSLVAGWASKLNDGCQQSLSLLWDGSEILQDNVKCSEMNPNFNASTMLCTTKVDATSCEFEIGAPLVQGDPPSVVGIKSSFDQCSTTNSISPVVYTRISHYYSWLFSIAGYSPSQ